LKQQESNENLLVKLLNETLDQVEEWRGTCLSM
jgi:hypothetical protein